MNTRAHTANTLIIGLGMTGLSCARFLHNQNCAFDLCDTREHLSNLADIKQQYPHANLHLGELDEQILCQYQRLVISPGIALKHPAIEVAQASGAHVVGDIELFANACSQPVIAITGSNGKSTVTTLVADLLRAAGKTVAMGGNIGVPALDLLDEHGQADFDIAVLELSSFQLETTSNLHALAATILNLSPDHMDRYDSLEGYTRAKLGIFDHCQYAIVNDDDQPLKQAIEAYTPYKHCLDTLSWSLKESELTTLNVLEKDDDQWIMFNGEPIVCESELYLSGKHNLANVMAALGLCLAAGVDIKKESLLSAAKTFKGLEHRCQLVNIEQGVLYYNDSKGTNVGSTLAAIEGLAGSEPHVLLIAGGVDKEQDFTPLKTACLNHAKVLCVFGRDAKHIASAVNHPNTHVFEQLQDAFTFAHSQARTGDVVLFSPACASFDQYNNYQERGQHFVDLVNASCAPQTRQQGSNEVML